MNRKKIIVVILLVALIGGGWYGYSEYTRKVKDLHHTQAQILVNAAELISGFEQNESAANNQYLGKIIAVKGTLKSVEKNDQGHYTVILGEQGSMSSIRCSMDSLYQHEVESLVAGTSITMKGACTGFNSDDLLGSDVILNRCVLDK